MSLSYHPMNPANTFNYSVPLPQFQSEVFARIRPSDVGKRKSFDKGPARWSSPNMIVKDQRDRVVVLFGDQLMKTIARARNPVHALRDMG